MVIDKKYCMSSFLTFRYIVDEEKVFSENLHYMMRMKSWHVIRQKR